MRPVIFCPPATILDCGASRTTLAVFHRVKAGKFRLERFASADLTAGAGAEAGDWLERIAAALLALRAQTGARGPVTVLLPPHLILMKMLSTPRVEPAKRDKIINFESQQSIPYPMAEVAWDRLIAGENGHGFNILLCAAKLEALDPLCAAVTAAGLRPAGLLPSVQALAAGYRAVFPGSTEPTLLVSVGARSTTLLLTDEHGFQARSLPLGGSGLTQQPGPAVQSLANRLAQEITRTLVHFQRPTGPEHPLRVMLTGGSSRLAGLREMLAAQLNLPVTTLDAGGALEIGPAVGDFDREGYAAVLTDLVGAAALQLNAGQSSLNLLPPRLRHQAGRRRLRPWIAVAAGLALAALVPVVLKQRAALMTLRTQQAALESELRPLREAAARADMIRRQLAEKQRRQQAVAKIATARTGWLGLLGELQARFQPGDGIWIERLQLLPETTEASAAVPLRLALTGVLPPADASVKGVDATAYQRVRQLLGELATLPQVAAVEGGRFAPEASGELRFDCVLVLKAPSAL